MIMVSYSTKVEEVKSNKAKARGKKGAEVGAISNTTSCAQLAKQKPIDPVSC
jgi:hypothetical protein